MSTITAAAKQVPVALWQTLQWHFDHSPAGTDAQKRVYAVNATLKQNNMKRFSRLVAEQCAAGISS